MLEIIISLLLLSMLLLGFDASQMVNMQVSEANYYFFVADQALESIAQHIRAYPNQHYQILLNQWRQELKEALPQGEISIQENKDGLTIRIKWGNASCKKIEMGRRGCLELQV